MLLGVCVVASLFFFLDRHSQFIFRVTPLLKFSIGPSRTPARFLDAACLGYVIWWIPRTIDRKLMTLRLFNFLNLLGKHSLQVFAASLFIAAALSRISHDWVGLPGAARTGLALVVVLSLAVPAWLHDMYRKRKRERLTPNVEYPAILRARPRVVMGPGVVSTSKEPA